MAKKTSTQEFIKKGGDGEQAYPVPPNESESTEAPAEEKEAESADPVPPNESVPEKSSEESPSTQFQEPPPEPPKESSLSPKYIPKGVYATDYFRQFNIPHCGYCGASYQNSPDGPICAEGFPSTVCPRLNNANSIYTA